MTFKACWCILLPRILSMKYGRLPTITLTHSLRCQPTTDSYSTIIIVDMMSKKTSCFTRIATLVTMDAIHTSFKSGETQENHAISRTLYRFYSSSLQLISWLLITWLKSTTFWQIKKSLKRLGSKQSVRLISCLMTYIRRHLLSGQFGGKKLLLWRIKQWT